MTLGLGFALGVAAFGISDAFISDNDAAVSVGGDEQPSSEYMFNASP